MRDVQALPPRDLLVVLELSERARAERELPEVLRLRVSADPDAPRLHLQAGRVHRADGPPGPFFRAATDALVGGTVASLAPVRADRIALLEVRNPDAGGRRALAAELFGRNANLVLLGPGDRVLALLVPPPQRKQPPRLALGEPWAPPPGGAPADPGPPLAELLPAPPVPADVPARAVLRAPLSWRVEAVLGGEAAEGTRAREAKRVRSRLERRLARARALVHGLGERVRAADEAERVRQDGELLKAALGTLRRGMESAELADWFAPDAPPRRIALDPKLAPAQNVERIFRRYQKLVRAQESAAAELARAERRLGELEELERRVAADDVDPLVLEAEAVASGLLDPPQVADERKRKPPAPRKPYRAFTGIAGGEILVGRTAKDNDVLTLRIARGNDVWLHTADAPGSHVVLRVEKRREPDAEDLLDAAHLAVHFSPLRGATRADVHVARRKEVHKPRGAKPGLVTLSGGRILALRVQPGRVEGLLRRARDGAEGE